LTTGGAGAVFPLSSFGIGSLSGAASRFRGSIGFQAAASVELELRRGVHLYARTQRSFGEYHDIASITFDPAPFRSDPTVITARPLRTLNQLSLSFPLPFDPTTFSLSYTEVESVDDERSRIVGISLNRPFGVGSTFFANAAVDLDDTDSAGVFLGVSIPLGDQLYASAGAATDAQGTAVTTDLVKPETGEIGSVGWRIRDTEGSYANRAASLSYRARTGRYEAGVQQHRDRYRAAVQADGAIVFAGGDIFLSDRIDDAFAVVDAGAPGVDVEYENRPAGRTNGRGKLLLPDLRSYEPNRITIDPANLPIGALVDGTREVSIPADRSGTVVRFAVQTDVQSALVTLRDEAGAYLEVGALGAVDGRSEPFTVGYDGQAYITGLGPRNRVVIDQPSHGRCVAEFSFQPQEGEQVSIPDTVCRPAG
jgi:outer membrane usher protein